MNAAQFARRALLCLAAAASSAPPPTNAQVVPRTRGAQSRDGGRVQRGPLDRKLEDRINVIIRERLALSDEQFARLRGVARRVETERRLLRIEEGSTRATLRRELLAGEGANDSTVAAMLDLMPSLERRRIDLMEREQSELAKFLSPVQRAKYIGLQDELRRTMQDLQYRRSKSPSADTDSMEPGKPGLRRPPRPPAAQ